MFTYIGTGTKIRLDRLDGPRRWQTAVWTNNKNRRKGDVIAREEVHICCCCYITRAGTAIPLRREWEAAKELELRRNKKTQKTGAERV